MNLNPIVAIHQPNFFPWLGYFNKIIRSDIFIVLDHVQFPKKGGTWMNRAKIIIQGKEHWFTIPVKRNYSGMKNVNEIELDNVKNWKTDLMKTLKINYSSATHISETLALLKDLISFECNLLSDFNLNIIYKLCETFNISTDKFKISSKLSPQSYATDMLIDLVRKVEGKSYLCGGGASKYQEDEKFEAQGINLIYQNFQQPVYVQSNSKDVISGTSIIDVLMNCGVDGTLEIISKFQKTS